MGIYTDKQITISHKKLLAKSQDEDRSILRILYDDIIACKPWQCAIDEDENGNFIINRYKGEGQHTAHRQLIMSSNKSLLKGKGNSHDKT